MRPLPPSVVFTVDEAAEHGWTSSALRNAVRQGRLVRPRRGVYSSMLDQYSVIDAVAAARSYRGSVVSHRSALLLHDLPLLGRDSAVPDLTVPPRTNVNMHGAHPHRASLRAQDVTLVGDTPVTSIARTLVDVGRCASTSAAVVAFDAALQAGRVGMTDIEDVLLFCWRWPGIRRAQRAVRLCDGKAESPLESISRLVLARLGLPEPELQANIHNQFGRLVGRGDFYWDEFGVLGEADGRSKYDERAIITREKERQEELEELGLVVVRWGWADVTRDRLVLKGRIERALERGVRRDRSGFPRMWTLGPRAQRR